MTNSPDLTSIKEVERSLKAFVYLSEQAPEIEVEQGAPQTARLNGATLAVKDLFDVKGMPVSFGSPIYADNIATGTAEAVARAEKAGATVVGKTVTTEFATFKPGPTTNPQNEQYTPGGSSSGSAAAVGAGLVTHALGTQTAGSVIRPAAFCGVVGFLPSMGLVNRDGLKIVSPSLDRIGMFARSVSAAAQLAQVIADLPEPALETSGPRRIGFFSDETWRDADEVTQQTMRAFRSLVDDRKDQVVDLGSGARLLDLMSVATELMQYEVARSLSHELTHHQDQVSDELKAFCQGGAAISDAQYAELLRAGQSGREWIARLFNGVDAIASPSAKTLPPKTLSCTGDPFINRAWSLLYLPCITLPTSPLHDNLKGAVQLVGAFEQDLDLITLAEQYETGISSIKL